VSPAVNPGSAVDGECLDAVGGRQLETYLTRTVVDDVDAVFRTLPDRAHRAVGGMSSGGYCALNLGLRHISEYSVILGIEPYGDPGDVRRSLLGGSRARYRANSPRDYIPVMRFTHRVAVFLDAGTSDRADVRRALLLARQLARRDEEVAMRVEPGEGHTWTTARVGLPFMLVFASEHMPVRAVPVRAAPLHAGAVRTMVVRTAPVPPPPPVSTAPVRTASVPTSPVPTAGR
jgi:hypothetical protein